MAVCQHLQDDPRCGQHLISAPSAFCVGQYHLKSGYIYDMGQLNTLECMQLDKHKPKQKNPYFPFSSQDEWELGKFLYCNLTQGQINDFLKLQWFEPIYLYWHDALEVMWNIFGNPSFSEHMMYDPYYIYEHTKHEYGEWMSGDEAHQIQNELPDGAMIVPIILASDKALVTRMSGDCEMHPLFLTIVNINSEVHMKAKAHAWACMVYTLIPEFLTHPNFHSILEACLMIACKNIDPWKIHEFQAVAKKHHLSGVQLPFWQDWCFSNPAVFLIGKMLHSCHKWFFDHVLKWCKWVLGKDELDACYRCQHKYVGTHHFTGISCVKQMTRCEHHNIQHTTIAAIAGGADADFVCAIHAIVDFIYRTQAPTFTTSSIQEMEACLAEFHQYKYAILEAGAQRGRTGDIPHFQILKLELFQLFCHTICRVGSLIQYTADMKQITHYLDHEESIHRFNLYTLLCTNGTLFGSMLTLEDGAIPLPHSVVPEEDYSFTGSATFHSHFLQGFILDDATTAFHVTQKPNFADKSISYVSMTYDLPDLPSLLLSYIDGVAGQNLPFCSWLLRGWSNQQVQALLSLKEYPYRKCDTILARVTSPSSTPTTLVVQVHTVFTLSTRGNALPPDLSYPLLYVQCFAFVATLAEQPEIGMYTVCHMFIENINGGRYQAGAIIPILDVTHAVKLIPKYGAMASQDATSEMSLELYDEFYLNCFSSKEFYYTIHDAL
ncbi:hypothetical protein EV401DRAFT_2057589 [Pisolithus croceorrhizus]|nr:hypothetical protein EV401DRAFT_2057589 [Pisolithus croceorrhizus]